MLIQILVRSLKMDMMYEKPDLMKLQDKSFMKTTVEFSTDILEQYADFEKAKCSGFKLEIEFATGFPEKGLSG